MFDNFFNNNIVAAYQKMHAKKQLLESVTDAPFMEGVDDEETVNFMKWKGDVQSAHPGKKLSFKGRVEGQTNTVSAEVPGEDRSYGVWDAEEKKGHVFTESDDTGGDGSAYNKWLLAKLGDLPRTEAGYEKGQMEGCSDEKKMDEELKGDQVKLDKNHNGEIDAQDLAIVRKEKVTEDKELIRDMVKKDALKEYHVAGTVNDKPFKMVTDDVYNYQDAKEQNPHLSDDEAKAVVDHTETDDFINGDEDTESVQNGHTVKTHTNGGYAGERDEVRGKLGLQEDALKEYHATGTVNGKNFNIVTDDVYSADQIKAQNPHLSDDEAKAVQAHTETDEFVDGMSAVHSNQGGHAVKTYTNDGYHGDVSDTMKKLGLKEDSTDTVCMDVPFLIRVMEFAKEDAKTDQEMHVAAEKMVELAKAGTLTMAAYDEVFGKPHAGPDGDNDADDQGVKEEKLEEVLTADTPIETWIKDFQDSDNPKFEGKSKEERRKMAIGAYYGAQKA